MESQKKDMQQFREEIEEMRRRMNERR